MAASNFVLRTVVRNHWLSHPPQKLFYSRYSYAQHMYINKVYYWVFWVHLRVLKIFWAKTQISKCWLAELQLAEIRRGKICTVNQKYLREIFSECVALGFLQIVKSKNASLEKKFFCKSRWIIFAIFKINNLNRKICCEAIKIILQEYKCL